MTQQPDFVESILYGAVTLFLIAVPIAALMDWHRWMKSQPPGGPREMAKASHGVGMAAVILFFIVTGYGWRGLFDLGNALIVKPDSWLLWVPVLIIAAGFGWLSLYGPYARMAAAGPEKGRILSRAHIKIVVGAVIFYALNTLTRNGNDFLLLGLQAVGVWCISTGAAKILLIFWGGHSARRLAGRDARAGQFRWPGQRRRWWWQLKR
jgi:hypothetical protein